MNIHKGEQFLIPFEVKIDSDIVAPSDVDKLRIQVGDRLLEYPNSGLDYDDEDNVWLYPLTEEQSLSMYSGKRKAQVSVMLNDSIFDSDVFDIDVKDSIITKRWTNDE